MQCEACQEPVPRAARGRQAKFCKLCRAARNRRFSTERKRNADYSVGSQAWAYSMAHNASSRAARDGREFDLAAVNEVLRNPPKKCPVLGIPFKIERGRKGANPASPTIDRLDNDHGYVRGNIVLISSQANVIKSSASPTELELVAQWMRAQLVRRRTSE